MTLVLRGNETVEQAWLRVGNKTKGALSAWAFSRCH
jgi:hypothetical protein